MHKIGGAHIQCVNNHCAKLEYKRMKTDGVTDYINSTPKKCLGRMDTLLDLHFPITQVTGKNSDFKTHILNETILKAFTMSFPVRLRPVYDLLS